MTPEAPDGQRDNGDNGQASALGMIDEDECQIAPDGDNADPDVQLSALAPLLALVRRENGGGAVPEGGDTEPVDASGVVSEKLPFSLPSRDASTRRLAAAIFKENPHLGAKHRFRLTRYAHLVRLIERVAARLNQTGPFKADDDSKRALVDLARLSSEARSLEDGLGLVPAAAVAEGQGDAGDGAYERIAARLAGLARPFEGVLEIPVLEEPAPEPDIIAEALGPAFRPEPSLIDKRRLERLALEVSYIEAHDDD